MNIYLVVVTRRKFCYSTFKVLTLCRLRGQSTRGVKTDIKRQTFRVANFPSVRTGTSVKKCLYRYLYRLVRTDKLDS